MRQEHIQRTTVAIRLKNTVLGCKKASKLNKNIFVNFRAYFICIFSLIVTFNHHVTTYIENHIFLLYFMQKTKNCNITVFGYKKGSNSKSDNWKIFSPKNMVGFIYQIPHQMSCSSWKKIRNFGVFLPPPRSTTRVNLKDFVSERNVFQHFWAVRFTL